MKKFWNNFTALDLKKIILLFAVFRIFDFAIIFFAHSIIPYLGFFPYKQALFSYKLPLLLTALGNFDGIHYVDISRMGYAGFEQAFFPLYPIFIKIFSYVLANNFLLSGIIVSNVSFVGALYLFNLFLKDLIKDKIKVFFTIFFLIFFPTSFFFGAVYTESLFLLLSIGYLYFLKKEKFIPSIIFGILSSLTRLSGVFLIFPAIGIFLSRKQKNKKMTYLINIASPLIGLGIYSLYLFQTTHDPLYFYHSEPAFGSNRSTHLIFLPQVVYRYIRIFITSSHNFQYFVSILEFSTFTIVFTVLLFSIYKLVKEKKKDFEMIGLWIFSASIIVLPTLTGTFSSVPRYALFVFSFFIALANIKNIYIKYAIIILFLILHAILLGYFSQGYFIS